MLDEYSKKRQFNKTPEPKGKPSIATFNNLIFVVQKHQASHLHYDLRLEAGGVLKSWAVPKGPTLNPDDKRLAMMVEDHPIEYANFEGVIPEGNYGAGTVMIWDFGTYHSANSLDRKESEKNILEGLKKDHISFVLNGQKLKGEFALVKLKKSREKDAWLLIKANDNFAKNKILNAEKSAKTNKTMNEIGKNSSLFWSSRDGGIDLDNLPKGEMPEKVKPMLATLVKKPFTTEGWIFEVKWDGYRAIAQKKDDSVILYSRNNRSFNERYPEIIASIRNLPLNMVMDGEIVVLDEGGKPDFSLMQNFSTNKKGILKFYLFDLLWLEGHILFNIPLYRRRQLLQKIISKSRGLISLSESIEKDGEYFFEAIKKEGLEGIIAKRKNSLYRPGLRSTDWLKIKTHLQKEAIIVGFTDPKAGRLYFGSLLLGAYEGEDLIYIGSVGIGFSDQALHTLYEKMSQHVIADSAVRGAPRLKSAHWVKPAIICEIKFQEWTKDNLIRQGVFLGLREDIEPKEVKIERSR